MALARRALLRQGARDHSPGPVSTLSSTLLIDDSSRAGRWGGLVPVLAGLLLILGLAACGGTREGSIADTTSCPQGRCPATGGDPSGQTIFGSEGIAGLFDSGGGGNQGGGGIGVNAFLWRASLETFSFLPLFNADPLGGIINYDWYAPPETPGERLKVNVYILDTRLRADAVEVKVFRQLRSADGSWNEAPVDPATEAALIDAVLTKARQLRIEQLGQ